MLTSLEGRVSEPDFNVRFNQLLRQLGAHSTFDGVTHTLHQLNALLGCKGSIVSLCSGSSEEIEDYRFILACDIDFKDQYRDNKWFQIDPYILYAQTNTAPVLLEQVAVRSPGQKRLILASRKAGYRSGAVIGVHSPVKTVAMSVLYIGSDDEGYFNEGSLEVVKMYLRAIAAEVLEWRLRYKRQQLLANVKLRQHECELLALTRQGYSSQEIAALHGKTKNAIDQALRRASLKIGAESRAQAAKLAWELGLLS